MPIDYLDVSLLDPKTELPSPPVECWLIITFEIVLAVGDHHYFTLEHLGYTARDNATAMGIWAPPYHGIKFELGPNKPVTVQDLTTYYKKYVSNNRQRIADIINYKIYHMGMYRAEPTEMETYIEFKVSPREGSAWKAYCIKRLILTNIDRRGLQNIADADGARGYRFLALRNNSVESRSIVTDSRKRRVWIYRGRILSTNVARIFEKDQIPVLQRHANVVDDALLAPTTRGGLFTLDLIGFSRTWEIIEEKCMTLDEHGRIFGDRFVGLLQSTFVDVLLEHGFYQYRLEGDGFLASFPFDTLLDKDAKAEVVVFEKAVAIMDELMVRWKSLLSNFKARVRFRASVIVDDYSYGRIGGLANDIACHAGKCLIRAVRMQTGIKAAVVDDQSSSYIAVDTSAIANAKGVLEASGWTQIFSGTHMEKTDNLKITIYSKTFP